MSEATRAARTPVIASAGPTSTETMRAWGWGLRTVAPQSMRSWCRSEE